MSPWMAGMATGGGGETGAGAGGFEAGRGTPLPERDAGPVDVRGVGGGEHGGGIGVERRHTGCEVFGRNQVVVAGPSEVRRPRLVEEEVEVPRSTHVGGVAHISDAVVASCELTADRLGVVGGGIVGDHQLEIGERLCEQRVEGVAEVVAAVPHGQPDTDPRRSHRPGGYRFSRLRR